MLHLCFVVNVWLLCRCHVVAPAILQSLIVPLCSPRGCCVVVAVSWCNTATCSFSAVCPPWEAFDQLRCCVCFRVWLLACSAPWLSGVLSELKPGFLQIVFSRIRRRVHDLFLMTISAISWRDKELNSMEEAIKKDFYALFTVCHMITRKINRRQYLLFVSKHQKSTQL